MVLIDLFISGVDDFNVPRLVLNQFRWLDCIIQSKVIKIVVFKIFRRSHVHVIVIMYWKIDKSKNHTHTLFMINNLFIQLTFTHNF